MDASLSGSPVGAIKQKILCSLATLVRTGGVVLMNGERRRG
jgi:hypothetical protein